MTRFFKPKIGNFTFPSKPWFPAQEQNFGRQSNILLIHDVCWLRMRIEKVHGEAVETLKQLEHLCFERENFAE